MRTAGSPVVGAYLMPDTWTALYDLVLDEAEKLAEAGRDDLLTDLMAWTVPTLAAASGDAALREREDRLRERTGVHLDGPSRELVESFVQVVTPED